MASVLRQTVEDIELIVVGDGVDDATRSAVTSVAETDPRVRFLDLPKGENRGERNRHVGVLEASSEVIAYLADDDLLMPRHVENLLPLLEEADLAQSANLYINADDVLSLWPTDLSDPRWVRWHLKNPPRNRVSITGTVHKRSVYLDLPRGWDVDTEARWTDLALWRQFFRRTGFVGRTHREVSTLQFPAAARSDRDEHAATEQFRRWERFTIEPDAHKKLQALAQSSAHRQLIELSARTTDLQIEVEELREDDTSLAHSLAEALRELERVRARERQLDRALEATHATLSWRITSPLRMVSGMTRRSKAGPRK